MDSDSILNVSIILMIVFTVVVKTAQIQTLQGFIGAIMLLLISRIIFGLVFIVGAGYYFKRYYSPTFESTVGAISYPEELINFAGFIMLDTRTSLIERLFVNYGFAAIAIVLIFHYLYKIFPVQSVDETELAARWKALEAKHNG